MDFEGLSDIHTTGEYYYDPYAEDGLQVDGAGPAHHFHIYGGTQDPDRNTYISTYPTGGNEYIVFSKVDGSTFDFKDLDIRTNDGGLSIRHCCSNLKRA